MQVSGAQPLEPGSTAFPRQGIWSVLEQWDRNQLPNDMSAYRLQLNPGDQNARNRKYLLLLILVNEDHVGVRVGVKDRGDYFIHKFFKIKFEILQVI